LLSSDAVQTASVILEISSPNDAQIGEILITRLPNSMHHHGGYNASQLGGSPSKPSKAYGPDQERRYSYDRPYFDQNLTELEEYLEAGNLTFDNDEMLPAMTDRAGEEIELIARFEELEVPQRPELKMLRNIVEDNDLDTKRLKLDDEAVELETSIFQALWGGIPGHIQEQIEFNVAGPPPQVEIRAGPPQSPQSDIYNLEDGYKKAREHSESSEEFKEANPDSVIA
jgi:hypothetical protein